MKTKHRNKSLQRDDAIVGFVYIHEINKEENYALVSTNLSSPKSKTREISLDNLPLDAEEKTVVGLVTSGLSNHVIAKNMKFPEIPLYIQNTSQNYNLSTQ